MRILTLTLTLTLTVRQAPEVGELLEPLLPALGELTLTLTLTLTLPLTLPLTSTPNPPTPNPTPNQVSCSARWLQRSPPSGWPHRLGLGFGSGLGLE